MTTLLPAHRVTELLRDGGTHLFPIEEPSVIPVVKNKGGRKFQSAPTGDGIFSKLHAMKVGDKPQVFPMHQQCQHGAYSTRYGGLFESTKISETQCIIWRVK